MEQFMQSPFFFQRLNQFRLISSEFFEAGDCFSFFFLLLWRWLVEKFGMKSSVFCIKDPGINTVDVYGLQN